MTDLDPEIWNNPTLGKASNNTRLDVVEKQELENRNAKLEGRKPREVIVDNDYPGWDFDRNSSIPSTAPVVHFADEQPNDVPTTGETEPDEENTETEPVVTEPDNDPLQIKKTETTATKAKTTKS